jgi:hypothetical protein
MPNPHRGEIEACLDGKAFRLCLTLSALAELEHAFNDDDMLALAERFQQGRLSARDAQRIIGAGLRGAGYEILDEAVGRMQAEGGAAGFVDIVARLLTATFGGPAAAVAGALAGEIASGIAGVRPSGSDTASAAPDDGVRPSGSDTVTPSGSPWPLRGGVGGGGEPPGGGAPPRSITPGAGTPTAHPSRTPKPPPGTEANPSSRTPRLRRTAGAEAIRDLPPAEARDDTDPFRGLT